jgi:hypothetical protein
MMSMLGAGLMTKRPIKNLEWRIIQAYVSLLATREGAGGERTMLLARYGSYEVRLVEPVLSTLDDAAPFWLESIDHKSKTTIDSYGSYNLEEVASAAEVLISKAESLHRDNLEIYSNVT